MHDSLTSAIGRMITQTGTHRIHVDVIKLLANELVTPNVDR